ncbi:WS/DGAT domain-containing protein [Glycomyces buryatensis]|uniref:diacylglycerol O-acyltransferase n=1 Tax=Glycomyces buryatensis TaxID=2570927 RepID=A0A4S8QCF9_9ACTN|nr:WS/DGAT domain-containing protein [Glycomyces buryatensis]THV42048.1 DUF1298 domain-containing protein [Glycomyces buryatensis]
MTNPDSDNRSTFRPTAMDLALRTAPAGSPETVPHIGMVLHCEGKPPGRARVAAHLAERLPSLPALTSYLAPGGKRWQRRAALDLDAYVVEQALAPDPDAIDRAVRELISEPLPEDAPHWQMHLLHGHAPDRYVIFLRVHHALQDASGLLHTLEVLFGSEGEKARSSAPYHGFDSRPSIGLGDRIRAGGAAADSLLRTGMWASRGSRFSSRREQHWCRVPTEALKAAAESCGGTGNDAYLAALAHALHTWSARWQRPAYTGSAVPLLIPANTRRPAEADAPGNRVAMMKVALPGGDITAAERLRSAPRSTRSLKSPRLREALRRLYDHMPTPLMRRSLEIASSPRHTSAMASNVALRTPLAFEGDPVTRIAPVMWAPEGIPLASLLLTYMDTTTVCFTSDRDIPGLDQIHHYWLEAVESLAGKAHDDRERPSD